MAAASCSSFVSSSSTITNYARLGLATQNELPNILRELLLIKEPPHLLEAHLNNNSYLSRNLKTHEWNIIRTVRTNMYNDFDVPLMYKIIRNLHLVPGPTQGWDNKTSPSATEITVGDDIERIRRIRNEIVHRGNTIVQDPELANYFSVFKDIASRLETSLLISNRQFVTQIEYAETCCIDKDTEELYLKRLKELAENQTQLAISVVDFHKELDCLRYKITDDVSKLQQKMHKVKREQEEVIPKNIRGQMEKDLAKWKQDDKSFVPTKASKYVFDCLKKVNCVTVVGSAGVGKTIVTRHVALQMEGIGYTIIPITVPTDIRDFYQPGKQTIFVIDDICGNFAANKQLIDSWKQLISVVEQILSDNCKIVVSCRLQVFKDTKFRTLAPFKSCQCNLISKDLQLSQSERLRIATAHLGDRGNDIPLAYIANYDFFPLLCFLCSRQDTIDIHEFFRKPFSVLEKELNNLWDHGVDGQCKICVLALCVIYNNNFKSRYLTSDDPVVRDMISDVCEACGLTRGTSRVKIKEEIETLVGTYLKREKDIYKVVHDKLFDFIAYYCGTKMINCLIEHAVPNFIHERFLWKMLPNAHDRHTDDFIIYIPDSHLLHYLDRLVFEWSHGKMGDVFDNNNMKNEEFRETFLKQVLHLNRTQQSKLAFITETHCNIKVTCLEMCCICNYTNLLSWILDQGVDINQCRNGTTPLGFLLFENNIQMISMLILRGADINLPRTGGFPPLYIASNINSLAQIKLLLKYQACVNVQSYNGSTPLFNALHTINTKLVEIFLNYSADCNIGLYYAQKIEDNIKNLPTYVKTIVDEKEYWLEWFTNHCNSDVDEYVIQNPEKILDIIGGATPLHMMCFEGDIDAIRRLLNRRCNINIRKEDGSTPLFVACQFDFIDIATVLLEHGADLEICRDDGKGPLDIARQNKHAEIVSLLEDYQLKSMNSAIRTRRTRRKKCIIL